MLNVLRRSTSSLGSQVAKATQLQQKRFLNVHEYQGAELMRQYGINVPPGIAVKSLSEVESAARELADDKGEVVIKSQILAGGRGLGTFTNGLKGGVHVIKASEAKAMAEKMLNGTLVTKQTGAKGKPVNTLYLAQKMKLKREMYFAILLDRSSAGPLIIACSEGGTSIEDLAEKYPEKIVKVPVNIIQGITDDQATQVAKGLGVVEKVDEAAKQIKGLYKLFCERDCTMVEVNPLAEDDKGLIAADAKLGFDDNAA
ncbi:ATP-grasp domain-containing protein, partial [Helicosporidium sp. ATCC 50920]